MIWALLAMPLTFAQGVSTFKVTNTNDSGEGSLRAAVQAVNASTSGSNRIEFAFSTTGEHVITLESFIYLNQSNVTIDASTAKGTVVLDGVDNSFIGLNLTNGTKENITVKGLSFRNFSEGLLGSVVDNLVVDGCTFESNTYGCHLMGSIAEVTNCIFLGNDVGAYTSLHTLVGANHDVDNNAVARIHDNYFAITPDNKVNGNINAIVDAESRDTYIEDNVICASVKSGISFYDKGSSCFINRNYIGVNKDFEDYGNGECGVDLNTNMGPIYVGSKEDPKSGNFIGYNKIGISNAKGSVNSYYNYIGVTPDYEPMPNDEAGIVSSSMVTTKGNHIGFNGTNGIEAGGYSRFEGDFIGGDGVHSFPNTEYGISSVENCYLGEMTGVSVFDNKKGGVMVNGTGASATYPGLPFVYSQCLFGGDQPFAVKRDVDNITIPTIDNMYSDMDYVYIDGHVALLDATDVNTMSGFALDPAVSIELFANGGGSESALKYLGAVNADAKGNFSFKMAKSDYVKLPFNNVVANATHQYNCTYTTSISPRKLTGGFSTAYSCSDCGYDLSRKGYYVKTKREGKGDGSSWENAMNGTDFADYLPLVPDGVTFYVAEGVYQPLYDSKSATPEAGESSTRTYLINSDVTIVGGYPADAKTGALSEPDKYFTVFDGKDDVADMFLTIQPDQQSLEFDGIVVKNTTNRAFCILNDGKSLVLNNDLFEDNQTVVLMPSEGGRLSAENTTFNRNEDNCLYLPYVDNIDLQNVTFTNNESHLVYAFQSSDDEPVGTVNMNHVTAVSNTGSEQFYSIRNNVLVEDCDFEKNNGKIFYIVGNNTTATFEKCAFKDNVEGSMIVNYQTSDLYVNNCEMSGNKCGDNSLINCAPNKNVFDLRHSVIKDNETGYELIYAIASELNVEDVTFENNSVGSDRNLISGSSLGKAEIVRNRFSGNKSVHATDDADLSSLIFLNGLSTLTADGNDPDFTLEGNSMWDNTFAYMVNSTSGGDNLILKNNTIASNKVSSYVVYADGIDAYLYNNTIVGNDVEEYVINETGNKLNLIGNIILGNVNAQTAKVEKIYLTYGSLGTVEYNIMPEVEMTMNDCKYFPSATNIVSFANPALAHCDNFQAVVDANQAILTTLFNGTFDEETGLFTPVMGLYNGGTTPTVALKADKLIDGTTIRFDVNKTIVDKDQNGVDRLANTCMGAYEYDPIVVDPTIKNYYVKIDGEGSGDGSNWENAMNAADFAAILPLVPDDVTFYVAEGEYHPLYGENSTSTTDASALRYEINSNVTILGGYAPDAKTGAVSDPAKYHTVFMGDNAKDDNYTTATFADGRSYVTLENFDDNVETMFFVNAADVAFDGVEFVDAKTAICFDETYGALSLTNCLFEHDSAVISRKEFGYNAIQVSMENVKINECEGERIFNQSLDMKAENVEITNNHFDYFACGVSGADFNNVTIKGNLGKHFLNVNDYNAEVKFTNMVVDDNSFYSYGDVTSNNSVFYTTAAKYSLYDNCQFTNNHIFNLKADGVTMRVSSYAIIESRANNCDIQNCEFSQNNGGSVLILDRSANLTKCQLVGNNCDYNVIDITPNSVCEVNFDECEFVGNTANRFSVIGRDNFKATNCLFDGNISKEYDMFLLYDKANVLFMNNTFVNNEAPSLFSPVNSKAVVSLYNNTVVGNIFTGENVMKLDDEYTLIGNFILGNQMSAAEAHEVVAVAADANTTVEYNVMPLIAEASDECLVVPNSTNIVSANYTDYLSTLSCGQDYSEVENQNAALLGLLSGSYNEVTNKFDASLAKNDGVTSNVAVKKTTTVTGVSILFDQSNTQAVTDQRGKERGAMTCMGSFHLAVNGTVEVEDVVNNLVNAWVEDQTLNVSATEACDIHIYDMMGVEVSNAKLAAAGNVQIELNSGVYVMMVSNAQQKSAVKFIVK